MSSGGKTQTTTTDTSPWKGQQPYLLSGFQQAENLSNRPKTMYGGQLTAGKTAADTNAENYLSQYAGTLAGQSDNNLNAMNWAFGQNLDVGNNPYVQGQMAANTNRLYQDFNDKTVPAIRSQFGQSGQIGGSRQGIAEGLAAQGVARASADSNANILGNAYQNALGTFNNALSNVSQVQQAGVMPGTLNSLVGESKRGFQQDAIDEQVARHNFSQNEADARLAQYMSLISGNFGGTTQATQPKQGGRLQSAYGGALAGLATGNPWLALAGGVGGALVG